MSLTSSAELFETYHARIRRHILSIVRDADEADDLVQEVFLQAHRKLGSLRDPDAVVAWLYRIATHVSYDRCRKWARRPRPTSLDDTSTGGRSAASGVAEPNLGRVLEQVEMGSCVRRYLDGLSDDYRNVILLHDLEGSTSVEIAELLGVSVDAVKIRLHRARRKLEAALATHCDFSHDENGVFVCEPSSTSVPEPSRSPAHPSPA